MRENVETLTQVRTERLKSIQLASLRNPVKVAQVIDPRSTPNRDRFLQPSQEKQPLPPQIRQKQLEIEEPSTESPSPPQTEPSDSTPSFTVQEIKVRGNTVFDTTVIDAITHPVEGRMVSLADLQDVARDLTLLYLNEGYITSKAVLVDQTITDGVVYIQVIEGTLDTIEVQGNGRLNASYIRDRIKRGIGAPLNSNRLEENLRLLSLDPIFKEVKARLMPGSSLGQSDLVVDVIKAKPWELSIGVDNYSVPSLAPERAGINFIYRNVSGLGDQVSASYYRGLNFGNFSQADSNLYNFRYQVPLNALNGTLQFRTDINNSGVTDPVFEDANIEGESELFDLSFRQPLVRTLKEEFALSLGFTIQNGESFIDQASFGEVNRNRVLGFGQDYLKRDSKGVWAASSQFNFGLNLLDSNARGEFFSWSGQAQRLQQLGRGFLLILQGDLQFTPDDTPSFYDFVIGGGQSVRGYRQNFRAGDSGYRFSAEARIPILRDRQGLAKLQLAPFFDVGHVWNKQDAVGEDPEGFLAGIGIGVLWEPISNLNLRLDYGYPLIDVTTSGANSLQDEAIHFSLTQRF